MIRKIDNTYDSVDGKTKLHAAIWLPDAAKFKKPVAILQICHGMIEFIDRYDNLGKYMAEQGIIVVGNDHLGHGLSAADDEDLGYFKDEEPEYALIEDAYRLTRIMKKRYPDIPYVIMGHSMGSFVVRNYICKYGNEVDACIIMGTGHQPIAVVRAGLRLTETIGALKGERYRSKRIADMMFGTYNKQIEDVRTANDWLTRDEAVVDAYNANKYNTFLFTVNGYKGLLKMILNCRKPVNMEQIPSSLPMLMMSGMEDPVGGYGKEVAKAYECYHGILDNVELRLYEDCRHELTNELNKEDVYSDIYEWIIEIIDKMNNSDAFDFDNAFAEAASVEEAAKMQADKKDAEETDEKKDAADMAADKEQADDKKPVESDVKEKVVISEITENGIEPEVEIELTVVEDEE